MSLNRRQFLQTILALGSGILTNSAFALPATKQHRRIIPSSGESIPAIGLGSWLTFGIDLDDKHEMMQRQRIMQEFLNRGGGMLDSSPMYGSAQEVIGRCL